VLALFSWAPPGSADIRSGRHSKGARVATRARQAKLVAAFDGRGGAPPSAARRALAGLKLHLAWPVFKKHEDWNI